MFQGPGPSSSLTEHEAISGGALCSDGRLSDEEKALFPYGRLGDEGKALFSDGRLDDEEKLSSLTEDQVTRKRLSSLTEDWVTRKSSLLLRTTDNGPLTTKKCLNSPPPTP